MEENRKKREKEDPSEKKKLCFCHFFSENVRRRIVKHKFFFDQIFCQQAEQQQGE